MTKAFLVAGLAYGDEGKGATVDFLTRYYGAKLIVRYNGGPQAAHNVVTPDGRHHTFAQFGSGMFSPGVKTFLSKHMLINPANMMIEADALAKIGVPDAFARTVVDDRALIITPYQKSVNRILETSLRHGSCGQGIGQTRYDHLEHGDAVLFAGDILDQKLCLEKLKFIRKISLEAVKAIPEWNSSDWSVLHNLSESLIFQHYSQWPVQIATSSYFAEMAEEAKVVIFEGAQGMLLDETFGVAPHTTWTDITFNNANRMLKDIGYAGSVERVGVLRSYFTRHGNGPFPTENLNMDFFEEHNGFGVWQGSFRIGKFDMKMAEYAVKSIGGVDWLAVNHIDRCPYPDNLETVLGAPIRLFGRGPSANDRTLLDVNGNFYAGNKKLLAGAIDA